MNFKKKAGAAVLTIAAASAIAVPGVAMATGAAIDDMYGTYTDADTFKSLTTDTITNYVALKLENADGSSANLTGYSNLSWVDIDASDVESSAKYTVSVPNDFSGTVHMRKDQTNPGTVAINVGTTEAVEAAQIDTYYIFNDGKLIISAAGSEFHNPTEYEVTTDMDDDYSGTASMLDVIDGVIDGDKDFDYVIPALGFKTITFYEDDIDSIKFETVGENSQSLPETQTEILPSGFTGVVTVAGTPVTVTSTLQSAKISNESTIELMVDGETVASTKSVEAAEDGTLSFEIFNGSKVETLGASSTADEYVATVKTKEGATDSIEALEAQLDTLVPSDLSVTFEGTELDHEEIEGFLSKYGSDITHTLTINNSKLEEIDVTDADKASKLIITGDDLTSIDGLDKLGSKNSNGTVTLDITASDLDSIDFGENKATDTIKLSSDLESVAVSGLDYLATLDVSGCSDLTSLDISDNDKLSSLNIAGTQLASLDTSETAITKNVTSWAAGTAEQGLYAGTKGLELEDNQYASVTENDDDDDYNDYVFDLDNITDGNGELVSVDAKNFTIVPTGLTDGVSGDATGAAITGTNLYDDDDWFDFDDGELTITAKDAPKSITYTVATDDDNTAVTYKVQFDVQSEGDRISGDDRYDTMVQINTDEGDKDFDDAKMYKDSDGNIVVASGEGFADALSASALAGALNTGIVTTASDSLTDDAIDMLDDMNKDQQTAYIVGGTSVVSYAVEQQLTDLGFSIKRFAGSDRFETAIDVQDEIQDMIDEDEADSNDKTVIIASGVSYADALAISPYAYTQNIPVVLVGADGQMDDDTADLFNKYKKDYSRAIIVGGTSVVSDDVIDTLEGYDMDVIRLAGSDRFETNLVINDWLNRGESSISKSDDIFEDAGYSDDDIEDFNDADIQAVNDANSFDGQAYVVTGLNYTDALAVAPLAGLKKGTINMVSDDDITTVTEAKDENADTTIVGGTSAISSDLEDEIEDL